MVPTPQVLIRGRQRLERVKAAEVRAATLREETGMMEALIKLGVVRRPWSVIKADEPLVRGL